MSDVPKRMDSAGRRSVSCWIYKVRLAVRRARHRAFAYLTENPENRLIRTRFSGADPYWWILAGAPAATSGKDRALTPFITKWAQHLSVAGLPNAVA